MKSFGSCKLQQSRILLLLDFDGTLAPIVKEPSKAVLPAKIKQWLTKLSSRKGIKVGIVTGRSLEDIRKRVGLKNLIYAANHGMEIFYNGKFLLRKGLAYKKPLRVLAGELRDSLSNIAGVIVENKGLSVAVHFRKTNVKRRPAVKKIVKKLSKPYLEKHKLQLTTGKMILEIRPAKLWNKGKAVLWIWTRLSPKYTPIYIGDDATDEEAFKALRPHGSTIRIGKRKNSHAELFINSIEEIIS